MESSQQPPAALLTKPRAIDATFQSRIKHNYEMLSEALRLMGRAASATDAAAKAPPAAHDVRAARPAQDPQAILNVAVPEPAGPFASPHKDTPQRLKPRPRPRLGLRLRRSKPWDCVPASS